MWLHYAQYGKMIFLFFQNDFSATFYPGYVTETGNMTSLFELRMKLYTPHGLCVQGDLSQQYLHYKYTANYTSDILYLG